MCLVALVYHNLREGDCDALFVKQDLQVAGQAAPRGEDGFLPRLHNEVEDDAAVCQGFNPHVLWLGQVEMLVFQEHFGHGGRNDAFQLLQVRGVVHADVYNGQRTVFAAVLEVPDVRVVHHLQVVAGVLYGGGAHADAPDHPAEVVQDDDVADVVLALEDDEEARDDVFNQALGAEAEDQADDADAGQHRGGVHAQNAQAPDHRNDDGKVLQQSAEEFRHRGGAVVPLAGQVEDPYQNAVNQPDQAQRHDEGQDVR